MVLYTVNEDIFAMLNSHLGHALPISVICKVSRNKTLVKISEFTANCAKRHDEKKKICMKK